MKDDKQVCGNCKWNAYDREENGFYCSNNDSEYESVWTAYDDTCEEWEEK